MALKLKIKSSSVNEIEEMSPTQACTMSTKLKHLMPQSFHETTLKIKYGITLSFLRF